MTQVNDLIYNSLLNKIYYELGRKETFDIIKLNSWEVIVLWNIQWSSGIDELIVKYFSSLEKFNELDWEVEDIDNHILYILMPEFTSINDLSENLLDELSETLTDNIWLLNGNDIWFENFEQMPSDKQLLFNKIITDKVLYIKTFFWI